MAQLKARMDTQLYPLDKWAEMVYTREQKGCDANRHALADPKSTNSANPSKEDTMTKLNRLAIAFATILTCSPAIAQANTSSTAMPPVQPLEAASTPSAAPAADTKVKPATPLPPVTVTAPAKKTPELWSKCDISCRMKVIAETLEKEDCRQDLAEGLKSKRNQAIIRKLPSKEHLVTRVEKICLEDFNQGDKIAEDLKLDETTAPVSAESEVDSKPAAPIREANGYGRQQHGRWSQEDDGRLEELLARKSQHVLQGIPTKAKHEGYIGRKTGPQAVPAGCTERKVRKGNEMFVRVVCN